MTKYIEDLVNKFFGGNSNWDLRSRRVINAGQSQDNYDYLTRQEIIDLKGLLQVLNGSRLTNLNASNLASGTVPLGVLPIVTSTWAPTGNGVSLTVNSAKYWKLGGFIAFTCDVTWPSTADGSNAQIKSFPVVGSVNSGVAIGLDTSSIITHGYMQAGSGIIILQKSGAFPTNADLSTANVIVGGIFL